MSPGSQVVPSLFGERVICELNSIQAEAIQDVIASRKSALQAFTKSIVLDLVMSS